MAFMDELNDKLDEAAKRIEQKFHNSGDNFGERLEDNHKPTPIDDNITTNVTFNDYDDDLSDW